MIDLLCHYVCEPEVGVAALVGFVAGCITGYLTPRKASRDHSG